MLLAYVKGSSFIKKTQSKKGRQVDLERKSKWRGEMGFYSFQDEVDKNLKQQTIPSVFFLNNTIWKT